MDANYRSYLELLDGLREKMEQLSTLAQQKTQVVRNDDLIGLNDVMKQEQAMAMTFRGLERKRERLLAELGLTGVPLTELPKHFPAAMQPEAQRTVERLRESYRIYQKDATLARGTLESSLREIERFLANSGKPVPTAGAGYTAASEAQPPQKMKTDFRV